RRLRLSLFQRCRLHSDLPSFPTRRSSDLLSFSLSPAHISLVHGEEGPLIRLISHTDDPHWLRVVGFIGWFAALGGFSLLGLGGRSEEHTSELQSRENLVCRLLLEKKKNCA